MSDEVEIETQDLQETIQELHKERAERQEEEKQTKWTRYIALTTAVLAAFAAVAALESGALANEGMMNQLQASDTWNEYQASRQKTHIYSIAAASLLDQKVLPAPKPPKPIKRVKLATETPSERVREYIDQVGKESAKTTDLSKTAKGLQDKAESQMHRHHSYAYSVALLQVAIALGAVSALTKIKSIWILSAVLGIGGIVLFFLGFAAK